jgi:hypothetical protein
MAMPLVTCSWSRGNNNRGNNRKETTRSLFVFCLLVYREETIGWDRCFESVDPDNLHSSLPHSCSYNITRKTIEQRYGNLIELHSVGLTFSRLTPSVIAVLGHPASETTPLPGTCLLP